MDGFRSLLVILVLGLFQRLQAKFVWNTGGASALFMAIALPLDLPRKEVFLSYNFEAGYELPRTWKKKPPVLRNGNGTDDGSMNDHHDHQQFDDFVYDDYYDDPGHKHKHKHHHSKKKKKTKPKPGASGKPHKQKHKNKHKHKPKPKPPPTQPPEDEGDEDYKDFFQGFPLDGMGDPVGRSREKRSLLSRTKFYNILSHRFEMHGLGTGDRCLLRLICEANSYSLADLNGVLGSLVHVMFSPSSSRYEALPQRYYTAELDGIQGHCGDYKLKCQHSVLDLITQPIARYKENNNKWQ
ncbi:uncharacterized protein Dana_GF27600 [Drosophila ananassae]|uniref:Uncharacterized protein n=1 Tax=Drosophila ananassae TaxID=7217 RepID=A0A0P8ZR30_DROAN|nr:uncharacterized protein LOC26515009 [Drosophila ananassae]KPU76909.1 uncharacterized protein Dana_GF27600 [Drosophila ananassae]